MECLTNIILKYKKNILNLSQNKEIAVIINVLIRTKLGLFDYYVLIIFMLIEYSFRKFRKYSLI